MKKYYLLSLISASLIGATCIQCTSPKQKSGENTLPQKSELFVSLPDYCPTPDGMAIAPNGDLILACPNFADITQPACLMRITKDGAVSKWLDVPVLEETGWASPMGLAFNEEGDLFISDNQGWSGAEKAKNKGRVLRLKFENDQLKETITVASGMEHPNGIRIRNGKLYVTQSSLSQIKDPSGLLVSGVYCFDMNDRDIAVTNTSADQNLLTTVITKNPEVQYGLDGIVFNEAGDLFVGNFGDGAIHRIKMDAEGKVVSNDVWAQDTTQLRTTDGMCIDDKGNIWVADFSANAVARVDKDGKIQRVSAWFEFNLNINNILVAFTSRKFKWDIASNVVGNTEVCEALRTSSARDFGLSGEVDVFESLVKISEITELVEREKKLDALRWNWMEDAIFFDYFTIERIFAFLLKLEMIERWISLDKERGNQLFRSIIESLKNEVQIPAEFR